MGWMSYTWNEDKSNGIEEEIRKIREEASGSNGEEDTRN